MAQSDGRGIFLLPPGEDYFTNEQLLKDAALALYMLHKEMGYEATLVSYNREKKGGYSYLTQYLEGVKAEFLPDTNSLEENIAMLCMYITQNHERMDVLLLYGNYIGYEMYVSLFKRLNPNGKVYVRLDANAAWIDQMTYQESTFIAALTQCDLVTVESKRLQKLLNQKWKTLNVRYAANGFLDLFSHNRVSFQEKENVIVTVGRIGTEQKANHIMLEAFQKAVKIHKEWKLKLIGTVEDDFQPFLEEYFRIHPHLREKVIITGAIRDKKALYNEYRKAKIFLLTSKFEGFPNVFAEAGRKGCYMITTDIDAAEDMTDGGALGDIVPVGDADALVPVLENACLDQERLERVCEAMQDYTEMFYDWRVLVRKIDHMLWQ